jgi:hypothetical protein
MFHSIPKLYSWSTLHKDIVEVDLAVLLDEKCALLMFCELSLMVGSGDWDFGYLSCTCSTCFDYWFWRSSRSPFCSALRNLEHLFVSSVTTPCGFFEEHVKGSARLKKAVYAIKRWSPCVAFLATSKKHFVACLF